MRLAAPAALGLFLVVACGSDPERGGPSGAAGAGASAAGGAFATGGASTGTGASAGAGGAVSGGAGGASGSAGSDGSGASAGSGGVLGNGWGVDQCPVATTPVGFDVGDSMGELVVKDCDTGQVATLDELCGARATWVFVAHTHCPTCKATAGFTDTVAQQVADKDVAIAHIVYDDNGTSCATWKQSFELEGIANVKVFEDPTGAAWSKLKSSNYTAPSAFLDENRVITFKAHGLTESAVLSQIDQALSP